MFGLKVGWTHFHNTTPIDPKRVFGYEVFCHIKEHASTHKQTLTRKQCTKITKGHQIFESSKEARLLVLQKRDPCRFLLSIFHSLQKI
jgi:hypothetical protein